MAGADARDPGPLRIGGWLPPERASSVPRQAVPVPRQLVRAEMWIPPATAPQLGEKPAHRRAAMSASRALRPRTLILVAVAAAASVPLVIDLASVPPNLSPPPVPRPAVLPSLDGVPHEVLPPAPDGTITLAPGGAATSTRPAVTPAAGVRPTGGWTGTPAGQPTGTGQPSGSTPPSGSAQVTISVEAEGLLVVRGGQTRVRNLAAASGGRVVTGIGGAPANTVRFMRIIVPRAGTYTLIFHYVATQELTGRVTVGGHVLTVAFAGTAEQWGTVGTRWVRLQLAAGPTTLEFGNPQAPAPDLDRIVLTSQ